MLFGQTLPELAGGLFLSGNTDSRHSRPLGYRRGEYFRRERVSQPANSWPQNYILTYMCLIEYEPLDRSWEANE